MKVFKGETVASGVALGKVYLQGYELEGDYPQRIPSDQVEDELNGLRAALDLSRDQLDDLKQKHNADLGENELRIFDVHKSCLADPMFVDEIEKLVMEERYSVRAGIRKVIDDYDRIFQLVENEYLRQRAGDFRDVAQRVLENLASLEGSAHKAPRPKGRYVLAARKLTVNDLFNLDNERVEGIVTEEGGISSHAGILARSMGIPTITGIRDLPGLVQNNDFVIIDAGAAELHVAPDERLRAEFEEAAQRLAQSRQEVPDGGLPHATRDGTQIELLGACANAAEVNLAVTFGMDGIGLYRTELMFLIDQKMPSEDMLEHHYREVARASDEKTVCFRLLDTTSKTYVPELQEKVERNPSLGMRGIRALLGDSDHLRRQVRAILRATEGLEDAAILVPFVTNVSDIQRVKAAIIEERIELRKSGTKCIDSIKVAPIIEVPAAVFVMHAFMNESDFIVVSIDDLQALLLAADRDNPAVRDYYASLHPAVFEVLAKIAREAAKHDTKVVLFGEGAADPVRIPFYLGIGIRSFSVAPVRLKSILQTLSKFTIDECTKISTELLQAPRALDVQRVLVQITER